MNPAVPVTRIFFKRLLSVIIREAARPPGCNSAACRSGRWQVHHKPLTTHVFYRHSQAGVPRSLTDPPLAMPPRSLGFNTIAQGAASKLLRQLLHEMKETIAIADEYSLLKKKVGPRHLRLRMQKIPRNLVGNRIGFHSFRIVGKTQSLQFGTTLDKLSRPMSLHTSFFLL